MVLKRRAKLIHLLYIWYSQVTHKSLFRFTQISKTHNENYLFELHFPDFPNILKLKFISSIGLVVYQKNVSISAIGKIFVSLNRARQIQLTGRNESQAVKTKSQESKKQHTLLIGPSFSHLWLIEMLNLSNRRFRNCYLFFFSMKNCYAIITSGRVARLKPDRIFIGILNNVCLNQR